MEKMKDFKKLKVWSRAMDFAVDVYRVTEGFPKKEMYSLVDQIRRAVVSIFSNIAEGCKKGTDKELVHFCNIALGSTGEIESQLIFSERIGYLDSEVVNKLISEVNEVGKMLAGFIKSVRFESEDGNG
jgi:four helix bundle protein